MILQLKREEMSPDITVLQLGGKLVLSRDAKELEWAVEELAKTKGVKVILDLSELKFIDSTGIGIVVTCSGKLKDAGGDLRVCGARGLVNDVLRKTKVDSIVSMCDSREDAATSLRNRVQAGAAGTP
ncbi:MAG: STAS domain-containing protein [Acidobacteria bacterium]|nr:STAS domain-containing protein [Acidobacteriota bacterium]